MATNRICLAFGLALLLILVFAAPGNATSVILNGSFEISTNVGAFDFKTLYAGDTSIDSWTVVDYPHDNLPGSIDYIQRYWQAADGTYSLDLNGYNAGGIQQTFATIPNQTYMVTFAMAGNPDNGPIVKSMIVNPHGLNLTFDFDITGASRSNMLWEEHSFNFVAIDTSTTLQFFSTVLSGGTSTYPAAFGPALDNVRVEPVPEPSSLILIGTGLIGAVMMYRRRR